MTKRGKVAVTIAVYTTIEVETDIESIPSREYDDGEMVHTVEYDYSVDDIVEQTRKWVESHKDVLGDADFEIIDRVVV